jgi:hypothetical protein
LGPRERGKEREREYNGALEINVGDFILEITFTVTKSKTTKWNAYL